MNSPQLPAPSVFASAQISSDSSSPRTPDLASRGAAMPGAVTPEDFARVLASRRSTQEFFLRHGAVCLGLSSGAAQDLALNAADAAGASQVAVLVWSVTANPTYANGRIPSAVGNR